MFVPMSCLCPMPGGGDQKIDIRHKIRQTNNVFTKAVGERAPTHSESCGMGIVAMSTYEKFQIIIFIALPIISVRNLFNDDHKK